MMTNQFLYQPYQSGDPARLGVQVINGIGFLGAGTIIVTKRNQIKGLTTAAGLWTSACAGLALGIGLYEVAAPACLSTLELYPPARPRSPAMTMSSVRFTSSRRR